MTTLITGGCGFIGSHLAHRLISAGTQTAVLDDLSTGKREALPAAAQLTVGDVTDPHIFDAVLEGVDAVFHLAAIASVERSRTDWLRAHQVNVGGLVNLFHAIVRSGRPIPVVYASSAAIYGDAASLPIAETLPAAPLSAYGVDKYGCELHGRVAAQLHGIPNTGLRFFNVYGPGQDPHSPYSGVISIFMDRARQGKTLTVFGDGGQTRDFVYVSDVVDALLAAMHRLKKEAAGSDVFNIGTGHPVRVIELAQKIAALGSRNISITHGPARAGEIVHSYCNNRLAATLLGITPATPLETGLRLTYGAAP